MARGWNVPPLRVWLAASLLLATGCVSPGGDPEASPTSPTSDATADGTAACELDAVEPFAQVPAPGYPFGVAVHDGITYVSTSRKTPAHPGIGDEAIFAFGPDGTMAEELVVRTPPGTTMGLIDMAVDSFDGGHRLYVVDMNGRVLRSRMGPTPGELGEPETYVTVPAAYGVLQGISMPGGMAFDPEGAAYLAYDDGRVFKIPPGGSPTVWFESPKLQGPAGPIQGGAIGARIGPDGKLYVSVASSGQLDGPGAGIVYRLPIGDPPQQADLEEFARIEPEPRLGVLELPAPTTTLLAFGASGRLYVSVSYWNAIAVFTPDGTLDRMITSPLLTRPVGLAFLGDELLVANSNALNGPERPEMWRVLRVCVQEAGLPLNVPAGIP